MKKWKIYLEYYILRYLGRKIRAAVVKTKSFWRRQEEGRVVHYTHRLFELHKLYPLRDPGLDECIREICQDYRFEQNNVKDIEKE